MLCVYVFCRFVYIEKKADGLIENQIYLNKV